MIVLPEPDMWISFFADAVQPNWPFRGYLYCQNFPSSVDCHLQSHYIKLISRSNPDANHALSSHTLRKALKQNTANKMVQEEEFLPRRAHLKPLLMHPELCPKFLEILKNHLQDIQLEKVTTGATLQSLGLIFCCCSGFKHSFFDLSALNIVRYALMPWTAVFHWPKQRVAWIQTTRRGGERKLYGNLVGSRCSLATFRSSTGSCISLLCHILRLQNRFF